MPLGPSSPGAERRIIGVAVRALGIEQLGLGLVQRCIPTQALDQIRIGDVRNAEGHRIGLAFRQPGVALLLGEAFVGDVDATEELLSCGPRLSSPAFSRVQMKAMPRLPSSRAAAEGLGTVGVAHVVGVGTRRQMHSDAPGAPYGDGGIGHFQQQSCAVFQ